MLGRGQDIQTKVADYGAFDVVTWRGRHFGIPKNRENMDLSALSAGDREGIIEAGTIEETKRKILDHYGSNHPRQWGGILMEAFGSFNIVAWEGRYLGVWQGNGPFDFSTGDASTLRDVVYGDTVAEVRENIMRAYRASEPHSWGLGDYLVDHVPPQELDLPEVIEIEPVHTCNMRCLMCHVSYENLSHERIDVPRLVKQLRGMNGRWAAIASSYEPVAHPQFAELAQGLTDVGMKIDVTTNGSLFTPKLVERIKDSNFRFVTISFDGIRKETYESIRRQANYERTLERIGIFKEALYGKDTYFNINETVMRRNIDEVPDSVDYWEKLDFDHLGIIFMRVREDIEAQRAESLEAHMDRATAMLDEAARRVIENDYRITLSSSGFAGSALRARYPEAFQGSVVHSRHPLYRLPINPRTHFQLGEYPGMSLPCRSPFKFAKINYDGDVILCQRYAVGNINEKSFVDIWFGEKAQSVRYGARNNPKVCGTCNHYRFCLRAGEIDLSASGSFKALTDLGADFLDPRQIGSLGDYRILRWTDEYYGVRKDQEIWVPTFGDPAQYPEQIVGRSEDEVRRKIREQMIKKGRPISEELPDDAFATLVQAFRGYNIVRCHNIPRFEGLLIALEKAAGPFNFEADDLATRPDAITGTSLEEIKSAIEAALNNTKARARGRVTSAPHDAMSGPQPTELPRKSIKSSGSDPPQPLMAAGPSGVVQEIENHSGRQKLKSVLRRTLPSPIYRLISRALHRGRLI